MKALTIKQPWATCIMEYGKDIENRTWQPPGSLRNKRIAIHAGKTWDDPEAVKIAESLAGDILLGYDGRWIPEGSILGTVVLKGWIRETVSNGGYIKYYASDEGLLKNDYSKWFAGPYGYVLEDPVLLPAPIPCRGMLGFWEVPEWITAKLEEACNPGNL